MAKSKVVRTLDADDRRFDATGAFLLYAATATYPDYAATDIDGDCELRHDGPVLRQE